MDSENCRDEHVGKVVRLGKETATVEIVRSAACEGCKACVFASKKRMKIPASNTVGAVVGDSVVLTPPPAKPMLAYLILFGVPLALLIVGLLVPVAFTDKEPYYFIGAAIGLLVGLAIVLALDRLYYSKKYLSKIVKILQGETKND